MRNVVLTFSFGAALLAQAPPALNGNYFFEEEGSQALSGQAFRSVGTLRLDGRGAASGTEYVKEANRRATRIVLGDYQLDAEGIGTLQLRYAVEDEDGAAQTARASYRMIVAASGEVTLLRTDSGMLAAGRLTPASSAAAALNGSYVVSEERRSLGGDAANSLAVWRFDGQGNVEARVALKSFYQFTELALKGRLEAQADGTFDLRLSTPAQTNEDGDSVNPVVFTYKVVPAGKSFELLRLEDGLYVETSVLAK